jgi:hypothetical protein
VAVGVVGVGVGVVGMGMEGMVVQMEVEAVEQGKGGSRSCDVICISWWFLFVYMVIRLSVMAIPFPLFLPFVCLWCGGGEKRAVGIA